MNETNPLTPNSPFTNIVWNNFVMVFSGEDEHLDVTCHKLINMHENPKVSAEGHFAQGPRSR